MAKMMKVALIVSAVLIGAGTMLYAQSAARGNGSPQDAEPGTPLTLDGNSWCSPQRGGSGAGAFGGCGNGVDGGYDNSGDYNGSGFGCH